MVNRFLSTFGALSIFALLVGFGARDTAPVALRTPAVAISQIPITHHFSVPAPSVGQYGGSPGPLTATMPSDAGLAISQVIATSYNTYIAPIVIKIDGNEVFRELPGPSGSAGYFGAFTINPPLIVAPGATLQIGTAAGSNLVLALTVTGYTLDAAYFGP